MAVTGKSYCDFFVYTQFGIYQERILFDPIIWNNILEKLQYFWHNYLAPEIILEALKTASETIAIKDQKQNYPEKLPAKSDKTNSTILTVSQPEQTQGLKRKSSDHQTKTKLTLFYCGHCENILKNKPKKYDEFCVACDLCDIWYHYKCVGIAKSKVINEDDTWICPKCQKI